MARFLCFFLLFPFWLMAEEVPHPELVNLFEADVVMDASFKSQNTHFFWVTINDVMKGEHFGLKKGDTIKLPREDNGCGFEVDYSSYQRARFYIVKEQYSWRLNYHSTQSIQGVYHFGALTLNDATCGLSYVGEAAKSLKTMNVPIREFMATYRWNSATKLYELKVSEVQLEGLKESNIMVAAFEKYGRCCLGDVVDEPSQMEPPEAQIDVLIPKQDELLHCSMMPIPPLPPFDEEGMLVFLSENDNPIAAEGLMGKVYVEFMLDEQGMVNEVKIVRGLHPLVDELVLEKVKKMPNWTPAKDQRQQDCKCKMVLPFKVDV